MVLRSRMPSNALFTSKRYQTTPGGFWTLKRRILIILFLLTLAIGFFIYQIVEANGNPFTDSFNFYILNEKLHGQGNWTTYPDNADLWVVDTDCGEGFCAKAIKTSTIHTVSATKTGEAIIEGEWSFYLRSSGSSAGTYIALRSNAMGMIGIISTPNGTTFKFVGGNGERVIDELPPNTWGFFKCRWDLTNADPNERIVNCRAGDGEYDPGNNLTPMSGNQNVANLYLNNFIEDWRIDYIGLGTIAFASWLEITYPESGSEMTQKFDFYGIYDLLSEDWQRVMIILEQWNEQSTCPEYGTPEFDEEYGKGWFIYQSFPFFSDFFEAQSGDFTAPVEDLRLGNYNCSRCYFINETEGTMSSEKCRGYTLNITGKIVYPVIPAKLPFKNWLDYYTEHSEKYPTPTGLFTGIANTIWGIVGKMGDFIVYVKTFFDPDEAMAKGIQLGGAIPIARGYLNSINDFFGGLPISTFFIFYVLCMAVVIAYKVILQIIKLIKP